MLPLQARVNLGVMAMKGYSAFPEASALLEPHHQIVLCHISTLIGTCLNPRQRCRRCILQPKPTGQSMYELNVQCLYEFISSFFRLFSISDSYEIYNNTNIGTWWMGTWLNILPSTKPLSITGKSPTCGVEMCSLRVSPFKKYWINFERLKKLDKLIS